MSQSVSHDPGEAAPRAVLAWHFTGDALRNGRAIPAVGETLRHDGVLVLCKSGLHASERMIDALQYAPGPRLHRVRCEGDIVSEQDKLVCRERTILWSHCVSDDLLRAFARSQALSVIHLWNAPEIVRLYLETGDESIRDAARAAAWAAARAAAWDAAWDAAWAAARAAAWDAAWAAARAAAWDAARAAAWDAANKEFQGLVLAEANQTLEITE